MALFTRSSRLALPLATCTCSSVMTGFARAACSTARCSNCSNSNLGASTQMPQPGHELRSMVHALNTGAMFQPQLCVFDKDGTLIDNLSHCAHK